MDRDEVPFVGRRAELADATATLDPGTGSRFLLVAGAPGIGKSRLLGELVRQARDRDVAVGTARALEAVQGSPYQALADALTPVLPVTLDELLPDAGDEEDGGRRRDEFFERVLAALRSAADQRPTLVVIDDVHWADAPTLRFLELLGEREPVPGLVVALAHRSAEIRPGAPLTRLVGALAGTTGVVRIELAALPARDIADLAAAVGPLPEDAVAELVEESGGNPLFALELARSVDVGGAGRRQELPSAVRAAVLARLERLPAETADALDAAAVLGGTFAVDVVATMLGRPTADVLAALDAAEHAALVEATDDPAVLSFSHPLICRAVYDAQPGEARARRHLDAARALSAGPAPPGSRLATLAYHYARASPVAGLAPAVTYGRRAADHALRQLAFEDAARLYGEVLDMAERASDTEPVERCEVLLRRAEALDGSGETLDGRATYAEAAELAADLGQPDLLARGALGRAGYRGTPGAPDLEAIALLDRSMAAPARDPLLRAQVNARQAMELYYLGERERRDELSASAVALARQEGDGRVLARVLVGRHYAVNHAGNRAEREALATEAARLAEAHGDADTAMRAHYLLVRDRLEHADRSGAEAAADRLRELAGGARRPLHLWRSMLLDALFTHVDGDLDRAEAIADEALAFGTDAAIPNAGPCHTGLVFLLRVEAGRLAELVELTRDSRSRYPGLSTWGPMLAWCQLAAGDDAGARATFDAAMAGFDDLAEDEAFLATGYALTHLAVGLGDAAATEGLRARLQPYRDAVVVVAGPTACAGPVATLLGRLAHAAGDDEEARAHLALARTRAEQLESPLFQAHVAAAVTGPELPGGLSQREAEVLGLLAAGLTNKEVAARLQVGVRTVDSHVSSIYRKVGARRRGEAVAFAMAHGIGVTAADP